MDYWLTLNGVQLKNEQTNKQTETLDKVFNRENA